MHSAVERTDGHPVRPRSLSGRLGARPCLYVCKRNRAHGTQYTCRGGKKSVCWRTVSVRLGPSSIGESSYERPQVSQDLGPVFCVHKHTCTHTDTWIARRRIVICGQSGTVSLVPLRKKCDLFNWSHNPCQTTPLIPSSSAIITAAFSPITNAVEYVFAATLAGQIDRSATFRPLTP